MAKNKMTNLFVSGGKKAALIALLATAPLIQAQAICPNDYYLSAGRQNVYNPIRNAIERIHNRMMIILHLLCLRLKDLYFCVLV